ncbi:MAG TPA: alpha/beta hydrolase [Smithellaceae bacterium]|nr:alpha/beta hydrolase [Smithellaceae bacterium]
MATIKVNGVNIYYELKGKPEGDEAVVFLNGIMSTVAGWALQVPTFAKAGYKILLHDFRGQLMSEKPQGGYTFSVHVADMKALLDNLGIKKTHIISTSYGGIVGLRFTLDYPEYVKSFTLIDGLAQIDSRFRWIVASWQDLVKEGDMLKLFRAIVPVIYSNNYLQNIEKTLRERELLLKNTPREFIEAFSALLTNAVQGTEYTAALPGIKCPVLLICGEHDQLTPVKFSRLIKEQIPHAEFVIVPECGHTTIYEKPEVVNSLALGFVTKINR